MSKNRQQYQPKPAAAQPVKVEAPKTEKTERYLVEARYSPRGEWRVESQDAVLAGAISNAGVASRKHKAGTAEHRVRDTDTGSVAWSRGHIETGVKENSDG